jgi:hypothetical protein
MPSRAQRRRDAQLLATMIIDGGTPSVFVFPDGGLQGNYHGGMDDERFAGPGETEIRVPVHRGESCETLVEQAHELLSVARADGQQLLRRQLVEAMRDGDFARARCLAPYVYRSGARLLQAIERQERGAPRSPS